MERAISTTPAVEVWKDIEGFEGYYKVSTHGRVLSVERDIVVRKKNGKEITIHIPEKIRKQVLGTMGYYMLHLNKDGQYKSCFVHRLVAEAFLPNPDNLLEVNHIDENKLNNAVWNLEWCDHLYNQNHGTAPKRISESKSKRRVEQLTLDGQHVAFYESRYAAARAFNRPKANIFFALSGRSQTAYGYIWRYVDEHIKSRFFTDIEQLTLDGQHVATYPDARAAANALGIKYICIYKALVGINKTAKGYRWRSKCSFI